MQAGVALAQGYSRNVEELAQGTLLTSVSEPP